MSFEDIRCAVHNMGTADQKRLIVEVVPEIWSNACGDDSCAYGLKEFVDRDMEKKSENELFLFGMV